LIPLAPPLPLVRLARLAQLAQLALVPLPVCLVFLAAPPVPQRIIVGGRQTSIAIPGDPD